MIFIEMGEFELFLVLTGPLTDRGNSCLFEILISLLAVRGFKNPQPGF